MNDGLGGKSGKSNGDPERVIARLKRDKADEALAPEVREKAGFLLAGIERGEVRPYGHIDDCLSKRSEP